jgi:hypothetical protein
VGLRRVPPHEDLPLRRELPLMVDFAAALARKHARKGDVKERGQDRRASTMTMRQSIGPDAAFEKLASQLIEAADKVPCSLDDYIAGLRYILGEVEVSIQAAKEMSGE